MAKSLHVYTSTRYYGSLPESNGSAIKGFIVAAVLSLFLGLAIYGLVWSLS